MAVVAVFFSGYLAYYALFVAKKPKLACKDTKFRTFLLDHCPVISEKYSPTIWCFESRAQTILRSFLKSAPMLTYEGELIKMEDGGQILLDWYQNDNDIYPDTETRPTVLLLPGLTGTSSDSYVLQYVHEAAQHGYRSVVFNNRGNGGVKLLTARTYCATNTEDLAFVVSFIKDRYPNAPLIGAGISLGGMILFQYLSKMGSESKLQAGMCVSVAWNVFESYVELEKPGINRHVLNRALAKNLVYSIQRNVEVFEQHFDDIDHVFKSSTIREFDDRFTSKMFGYEDWQDYYKDACIHNRVHKLRVPVLVLSAADDPFSPFHAIPIKEAEQNDNIAIVVTSHGGHIGFLEGILPRHGGYMDRLFSQFSHAIFEHGPKTLLAEEYR
ncbi:phospholipase ABHD3-like [Ylistrum balloti]|uniref:phospholipase ABHD3-like n=1 Tax=Ylistrum balloti TaxID=509963 RepID=UPI002905A7D0|nr:phospholipase ABHD3-like [Ylistrum balloti]